MSKFRQKRVFVSQNFTIFGIMKRGVFIALFALVSWVASADVLGIRTEWGVVAGINQPFVRADMGQSSAALKEGMGFTAGLHMGLRIVGILGIQPEILYSYSKIGVTDEKQKFETDIKCSSLQIPLLVSLRLALVRFNIGPVFTVMDNPTYLDRKSEKVMFGAINPTLSYAVGASVCLAERVILDARVSSGLKSVENFLSYDATAEGHTIKTTTFNAQLKVGILF